MNDERPPIRIQWTNGPRLVAEVVVENDQAERTIREFCLLKIARGMSIGGIVRLRADLPRTWNVPVGARVHGFGR